MESVGLLRQLGFAEYEAKVYTALLRRSPLTGYELAKFSGVPRADIYSVLQKLEGRGAVLRLTDSSGTRYAPSPRDEVIGRLERAFQETASQARTSLEEIVPPVDFGQVWNLEGRGPVLDHAISLVEEAERSLLLALGPEESASLETGVARAQARGVEITTLCHRACPLPCPHCRGELHRHGVAGGESGDWLVVIRDEEEVVAGLLAPGGQAAGLRTRQPLVVEMARWHVRNGIALAALLDDLTPGLDGLLKPETQGVLDRMGPAGGIGWLEYMASLRRP